jgi:hypothetical protein
LCLKLAKDVYATNLIAKGKRLQNKKNIATPKLAAVL